MTTRRCRTVLVSLASLALVLLLGGPSISAQEQQQQKEPPKKTEPREKRGEAKPAKAQEKPAAPQQANKPKLETPAPQSNRPKQETVPPAANRPAQQTPPPTASPRTQPQRTPQGSRPAASEATLQGQQGEGRRGAAGVWPVRPSQPGRVVTTRGGDTVHRDQAGRVTEVHVKNGAVVYHAPSGIRRVEVARPGDRVVVAQSPGHGYVQRPVVFHDRSFIKRTYFVGGRPYARVYRPVTYRGVWFQIYTPVRFYRPAFYAYLFNPWLTPVAWSWGWGGNPWYGYYDGYFVPYAYYRSPALWLTDFFIAATLQAAYQERVAVGMTPASEAGGEVALSPEVKQLIADEVQRQLERERAEGQTADAYYGGDEVPVWADNTSHVFVAYTALGVNSNLGYCTVGEGDVLQLRSLPAAYASSANVLVLASRRQDCRKGSMVTVQLQDLQDMSNRMRETVERGLGDLQAHQGQSGIPPLPAAAVGTVDTPLAAEATPDPDASTEVNQAYTDADQAEQAALAQAGSGTTAGTPTVSLGQTIDQVRAILGPPQQIMDAGSKQIYIYRNVKITFMNGRVTDIQ